MLQHHAVRAVFAPQELEPRAHLGSRSITCEGIDLDLNPDSLARLYQVARVSQARFLFSDEDDYQLGMNPTLAQRTRTCKEFGA